MNPRPTAPPTAAPFAPTAPLRESCEPLRDRRVSLLAITPEALDALCAADDAALRRLRLEPGQLPDDARICGLSFSTLDDLFHVALVSAAFGPVGEYCTPPRLASLRVTRHAAPQGTPCPFLARLRAFLEGARDSVSSGVGLHDVVVLPAWHRADGFHCSECGGWNEAASVDCPDCGRSFPRD